MRFAGTLLNIETKTHTHTDVDNAEFILDKALALNTIVDLPDDLNRQFEVIVAELVKVLRDTVDEV
jgi:hypothetical protein